MNHLEYQDLNKKINSYTKKIHLINIIDYRDPIQSVGWVLTQQFPLFYVILADFRQSGVEQSGRTRKQEIFGGTTKTKS